MITDQSAVPREKASDRIFPPSRDGARVRRRISPWAGLVVTGLPVLGGGLFFMNQGQEHGNKKPGPDAGGLADGANQEPRVQAITPERGGMERVTSQPGTIRAFEFAPLFTKVSGVVKTLNVDRGSRVKKGDLLAEIYDPERDVAVIQGQASLDHSKAMVEQAQASILTAQAFPEAAKARQHEVKANVNDRADS